MTDLAREKWPIVLEPHSPRWTEMAHTEAARLTDILGDDLIVVHHIGSTAIAGIKAKPIVDLMPVVTDIRALDEKKDAVTGLGYEWFGEFGVPGRRYCRRLDPQTQRRLFHVHFYAIGNPEILRHVAFRDYLIAYPDIARDYEREKEAAAALNAGDMAAYNDAKNDWVKRIERDALAWWPSSPRT